MENKIKELLLQLSRAVDEKDKEEIEFNYSQLGEALAQLLDGRE